MSILQSLKNKKNILNEAKESYLLSENPGNNKTNWTTFFRAFSVIQ